MKELDDLEKIKCSCVDPTTENNAFWIYAKRQKNDYVVDDLKSGKWIVVTEKEEVNHLWSLIKQATEEGKLGYISSVSTAKLQEGIAENVYIISVYTGNYSNLPDVMRVRQSLRKIGISEEIIYKTDKLTKEGERKHLYKL